MNSILCRVGWMTNYQGPGFIFFGSTETKSWWDNQDEKKCGEFWNFMIGPHGLVRGFTMLKAKDRNGHYTGKININRLGAEAKDDSIEGTRVIFYAPSSVDKKNYIIGWYENAKVYRYWVNSDDESDYRLNDPYSFEVRPENVFLIPENERNIHLVTSGYAKAHNIIGSFPGQTSIFFMDKNPKYFNEIINKLDNCSFLDRFMDPSEPFMTKEGKKILQSHLKRERSAKLIAEFKKNLKTYECRICGFDFEKKYGRIGHKFIEAHHLIPLGSLDSNVSIAINDLIAVCSNCHRMLHREIPPVKWQDLKRKIQIKA